MLLVVNILPADDLMTQGARASVGTILTKFTQNILLSLQERLVIMKLILFKLAGASLNL